jgi:hypothetical protein
LPLLSVASQEKSAHSQLRNRERSWWTAVRAILTHERLRDSDEQPPRLVDQLTPRHAHHAES